MRGPARVIELRDEGSGLDAFVVVDHELLPVSAGGTRMLADVSVEEVARLARAMTWKFAACRVSYAGAKAGIRFRGGDRAAVMAAYLRAVEPLQDFFLTGPDMGTFPSDFTPARPEAELPIWAREHEGLGMDDLATGHGVRGAAQAALRARGRDLEGATFAIEGFGKVGAGTARACARAGARVVAVSTVHGLLVDREGLDVEALIGLREAHGDRFVEHAPLPPLPRDALFELECDVLVPGARPDSVTPVVAERLHCAVVAPGANAPYGVGAVEILDRRGIVALPDFVANSGGVHLYESVPQDGVPEEALATIERLVAETVARLLDIADEERITPMAAAFREVRAFLREKTEARDEQLDELVPSTLAFRA